MPDFYKKGINGNFDKTSENFLWFNLTTFRIIVFCLNYKNILGPIKASWFLPKAHSEI